MGNWIINKAINPDFSASDGSGATLMNKSLQLVKSNQSLDVDSLIGREEIFKTIKQYTKKYFKKTRN